MALHTVYRVTYRGPTNHSGSRFIVRDTRNGTRVTVPFDYAAYDASESAAKRLAARTANVLSVTWAGREGDDTFFVVTVATHGEES